MFRATIIACPNKPTLTQAALNFLFFSCSLLRLAPLYVTLLDRFCCCCWKPSLAEEFFEVTDDTPAVCFYGYFVTSYPVMPSTSQTCFSPIVIGAVQRLAYESFFLLVDAFDQHDFDGRNTIVCFCLHHAVGTRATPGGVNHIIPRQFTVSYFAFPLTFLAVSLVIVVVHIFPCSTTTIILLMVCVVRAGRRRRRRRRRRLRMR